MVVPKPSTDRSQPSVRPQGPAPNLHVAVATAGHEDSDDKIGGAMGDGLERLEGATNGLGRAGKHDQPVGGGDSDSPASEQLLTNKVAQGRRLRVLLAEDVHANQRIIVRTLEKRGHSVEVASNGMQALELASRAAYDVILMDVQMPEMDGLQATAALKARDLQPQVPIIAITAHAMAGDRQRCMEAGMDDYLTKPLDLARLVQAVERFGPRPAGKPRLATSPRDAH